MLKILKLSLAWILKNILPPQRNDKKIIEAVYEEDIEDLLKKLGLWERFERGEYRCGSCQCVMKKENIQSIFCHGGEIGFCCENIICYEKLIDKTKGE